MALLVGFALSPGATDGTSDKASGPAVPAALVKAGGAIGLPTSLPAQPGATSGGMSAVPDLGAGANKAAPSKTKPERHGPSTHSNP